MLSAIEIKTREPDAEVMVMEKDPRDVSGGLLRSEVVNGYTFDCGGPHILFSRDQRILNKIADILGDNVTSKERKSFVCIGDKFIPYPFENGMYMLPPEKRVNHGSGLIAAALWRSGNPNWHPTNFQDWVYGFFGKSIGDTYLAPYNQKIWKRDLDQMSADWVYTPGRVPTPDVESMARAIAGLENTGYKEQAIFIYPKWGGIQSLYRSVQNKAESVGVDVQYGCQVRKLLRTSNRWQVNHSVVARTLVSTLPLPELIRMIGGNLRVSLSPSSFDFNSVVVVGISMRRDTPDQTAVYVPRKDVPFHRYTWMSYLTPPEHGGSNLIAEVTVPPDKKIDRRVQERRVIKGLSKIGVISGEGEVDVCKSWVNKYGYPIYSVGHRERTYSALEQLANSNIYSVGRWGSWEYWNTDMVMKAVENTVSTIPRVTGQ